MNKTYAALRFVTERQLLEALELFENKREMEAAKLFAAYAYNTWPLTTIEAHQALTTIASEWGIVKKQR